MNKRQKTSNKEFLSRRKFLTAAGMAVAGTVALRTGSAQAAGQEPSAAVKNKLNVLDTVDVLVVGGGPAGIGAALGAARTGARTLLIENHSFFGGVGAWAMGMSINQVRPNGKPRSAVHELLVQKLQAYGDQAVILYKHQLCCNVEYLKVAVLDALDEVGCRYLVHVRAADAIVENNRVVGVLIVTKRGLMAIRAKTVVDCTGDADVAYYAGAETMTESGNLSPSTLLPTFGNVTKEQLRAITTPEIASKARDKYPLIPTSWDIGPIAKSHGFYSNHGGTKFFGQFDATDPLERTKAECLSRRQVVQMIQAMREFGGEGLKDIELTGAGPQMGVRETRRVKGLYVLTEEDAKSGARFEDVIAWRAGRLDIGFTRDEPMKIHDVPYRAILPEKMDGLLVAGRCISATHVAASAGKSMGNCLATGHAAGLAAVMCARKNLVPREVKVAELQDALRADGVNLDVKEREQKNL